MEGDGWLQQDGKTAHIADSCDHSIFFKFMASQISGSVAAEILLRGILKRANVTKI
jgi:hypothetical protein